jgi:hypothetical protein
LSLDFSIQTAFNASRISFTSDRAKEGREGGGKTAGLRGDWTAGGGIAERVGEGEAVERVGGI